MRSADHQERAALGDHAAEERDMRRVVGELVFEGQLGAGFFVGGELDQAAALVFELRVGAPGIRVRQDTQLAQALCLVQPCLSQLVFSGHLLVLLGFARLLLLLFGVHQQVGLDELVEVAVEHGVRVVDLVIGALILDHRVRL